MGIFKSWLWERTTLFQSKRREQEIKDFFFGAKKNPRYLEVARLGLVLKTSVLVNSLTSFLPLRPMHQKKKKKKGKPSQILMDFIRPGFCLKSLNVSQNRRHLGITRDH